MLLMTKTDVFNRTIRFLGQSTIILNADTDLSTISKLLRNQLPFSLNKILAKHDWTIFRSRTALALLDETPTNDWAFAYAIPENCNTVRSVMQDNMLIDHSPFPNPKKKIAFTQSRHGGTVVIFTNLAKAWAEFTAIPEDDEALVPYFGEALAAQLAEDIAPSIITNNYFKVKEGFMNDIRLAISEAIAEDIQKQPEQEVVYSPFMEARNRFGY